MVQERPTEQLMAFLDLLARFGGEAVRTRTLTAKGLTQEQLRYRQQVLGGDGSGLIDVRTIGERVGEQERLWSLTAKGEWLVDDWRSKNGTPKTDDDAAPANLTKGEVVELQDRLRALEEAVGM